MKLEQMCCSLESARRLRELGVKQESYWFWKYSPKIARKKCSGRNHPKEQHPAPFRIVPCYESLNKTINWKGLQGDNLILSAFTTGELGELLPKTIRLEDGKVVELSFPKGHKCLWRVDYHDFKGMSPWMDLFESNNEAEARALLLIFILENKLCPTCKE